MTTDTKTTHHLVAADLVVGEQQTTARPPRRKRRPTLAQALRQAQAAGASVRGATITDDGVSLTFGGEPAKDSSNGSGEHETPDDLRKLI